MARKQLGKPAAGSTDLLTKNDALLVGLPSGAVSHFAMNTPPTGWLKANGAAVSRTTYAALYAAIGTTFGTGDGSTTFALPDLRGQFLRSWADNGTVDSGRTFGSLQGQLIQSHYHILPLGWNGTYVYMWELSDAKSPAFGSQIISGSYPFMQISTATQQTGSLQIAWTQDVVYPTSTSGETRPTNVALLACIKY